MDQLYASKTQCPLGAGHTAQQNWLAFSTWAMLLVELLPARVIELGTGSGGFSLMLAKLCHAIGIHFVTIDRTLPDGCQAELRAVGAEFWQRDLAEPAAFPEIAKLIGQSGLSVMLCDNGAKVTELHTLAPALKPGDLIAAHDYLANPHLRGSVWRSCEVCPADVADLVKDFPQFRPDWFDPTAWVVLRRPLEEAKKPRP